ncbi:IMPACT family member yigZ [Serratia fonticola]|uniref:IMPACT family member yigZ n=1 Tax=Serratia fonticola TaxID=47917 RepID=A0A4U9WM97_SERFO|nr:IMPACT family member yigZ [Serratia fonticola]
MGSGIGEITAVVVRYYGGIKLGTGGLVRAYGSGVQQALKQLVVSYKVPQLEYTLQCDYAQLAMVENLLQLSEGRIVHGITVLPWCYIWRYRPRVPRHSGINYAISAAEVCN